LTILSATSGYRVEEETKGCPSWALARPESHRWRGDLEEKQEGELGGRLRFREEKEEAEGGSGWGYLGAAAR
jgi:hypothetical protein